MRAVALAAIAVAAARPRASTVPQTALLIGFTMCYPLIWCFLNAQADGGLAAVGYPL